jgi:hypothetical protein
VVYVYAILMGFGPDVWRQSGATPNRICSWRWSYGTRGGARPPHDLLDPLHLKSNR